MNKKKLTKSRTDKVFLGVIGGIAEYLGISSTLLRIIFLLVFWSGGPVIVYFLLALIIPDAPKPSPRINPFDAYDSIFSQRQRNYTNQTNQYRPRKEARKVEDDEWSDF
ncbi:phage shock protein C (PspC) family protein [Granulicatella balaenopterae]|uniref:Phage shock protein C (PspC) family protein n=1 Tax=Granulicatella balaenopterae TaxID=137733 RepID=A0A1H9JLL8_9LACT|nr:PspC domain-containing protein [Granulicatella balaenopterae]SEQ87709.1 phage shock protein C (PspC) family protein [Granulicatella balaenopterae]